MDHYAGPIAPSKKNLEAELQFSPTVSRLWYQLSPQKVYFTSNFQNDMKEIIIV